MSTIIKSNVKGVRTEREDLKDGFWTVNGKKYTYSYANSIATDGERFNILHAPIGTELMGDIVEVSRTRNDGDKPLEHYTDIAFHPHEKQFDRKTVEKWTKDRWIRNFGSDKHYYSDVESVTYKDPKSKTGKLRTDKCYGISIQNEVNVIVWRKNGKRSTMSIPIDQIVERHLKTY